MRAILALTLALAVLLSACSDGETPRLAGEASTTTTTVPEAVPFVDEEPVEDVASQEPLTLRVGLPDLLFLAPHEVDESNPTAVLITDLLTDGLTSLDRDGEVEPAIAESWAVSEDGLVWTFTLGDHDFSTGAAITADDVVASLNRTLDRGDASLSAAHLTMVSSVEPVDESTLEIALTQPAAELAEILAGVAFGIAPADEDAGADLPVSSAIDFAPTSWLDDGIRFVGEQVAGEVSTIELMLDEDGSLAAFGDVDISLVSDEESVDAGARGARVYFGMQMADGPLADVGVRRAVLLAVDGDAIQSEFFPNATRLVGLLPWSTDACGELCEFDPDAAASLVEASAVANQEFFIDYFQVEDDDFEQRLAEAIAGQLRDVGLLATARAHSLDTYGANIANGEVDLFRFGTAFSTGSGLGDLASTFGSNGNDNVSGVSLDELDALLVAAATETDDDDRRALYEEAEMMVFDSALLLPLVQLQTQAVLGDSLTAAGFSLDGSLDLDSFVWAEAE